MQATPLPAWPLAAPVAADRGPRAAADPAGPGEGPGFGEQFQAARRERAPAAGAPRPASAPARPSAPGRAGKAADAASAAPAEAGGEETPDDAVEALAGHRATARLRAGTPGGGPADEALGPGGAPPAAALALRGARAPGAAGRQEAATAALEGQTGISGTPGSPGTPGAAGRLGSGGPALSSSAAAAASWRAEQDAARAEAHEAHQAHEAHESREALALAAADRTIAARLGGDNSPTAGASAAGGSGAPGAAASAAPGALSPLGTPATPGALPTAAAPVNGAEPPTFLLSPPLDSPTFAPALGLQLSVLARDGIEQARMQLNPESMGPISVQLSVAGNQVNIDFVASQAPTREALEQSMPELASAMRDAGFTMTGGGVFQQARDGAADGQARSAGSSGAAGRRAGDDEAAGDGTAPVPTRLVTPRGLVDVFA